MVHVVIVIFRMLRTLRNDVLKKLRSCRTPEQLLALDEQMMLESEGEPLYRVICEVLRHKAIAPVEAARWLATLMDHRDKQLNDCLHLNCQI